MCVFASYVFAGNCMSSNGPWIAIASSTIAESGIARLAGNADVLLNKGNTPSGNYDSNQQQF